MSFWIVTDACSDLPRDYILAQNKLMVIPMHYQADDSDMLLDLMSEDFEKNTLSFYDKMRGGASTKTAQINQGTWEESVKDILNAGEDVLILAFSGGLSSTAQQAILAAEELSEQYPERKIYAVDTLCASMGEGLFVHYVLQYRDNGHNIDDCRKWAEENNKNVRRS